MSRYLCFAVVACGVLCCRPSHQEHLLGSTPNTSCSVCAALWRAHSVCAGDCSAGIWLASWAVSRKGAVGLMQLMPSMAARLGVRDPCNLNENVSGGVRYLAWLMHRFQGDLRLVAASYIAGEGVVTRRGLAYHNAEVVTYVSRIRANCRPQLAGKDRESPAGKEQSNPMKICWIFVHLITLSYCLGQADSPPRVLPDARIVRLTLDTQSVTVLHLRPGYVSSVRLPEESSSVVLGNPGTFKAEHSEAEPRLVFLKPTTASRAETNALITTTELGMRFPCTWS